MGNKKMAGSAATKAQMLNSQIFIYILAMIVTSLILLYGYDAIGKMREQTKTVSTLQFKTDITNAVESLGYEFGTVEIKSLSMPGEIIEICFTSLPSDTVNPPPPAGDPAWNGYQTIEDSVYSSVENNMFLLGSGIFDPHYIGPISVDNGAHQGFKCWRSVGGKVRLRLEAKGRFVLISDAP